MFLDRCWPNRGKDAVMDFYLELHVFGAVPVRKKDQILKGGIHCISRSSLGTFILCAGTHWAN